VDEGGAAPMLPDWPGYRVSSSLVEPAFFDTFEAPAIVGRTFTPADYAIDRGVPGDSGARGGPVIVNESFVRLVLGGRNPIGRRLRYTHFEDRSPRKLGQPSAWYEIVGVVRDMGMAQSEDPKKSGIYHPVAPGSIYPAQVAVHLRGDPSAFVPRLRTLAADVDPTMRLYDVMRLDEVNDSELEFLAFWFQLLLVVSGVALTLSLAGIYSVMSFTVVRRTREIGIRIALGASPRGVILAIFRRPLIQVALGILAGGLLTGLMLTGGRGRMLGPMKIAGVLAYSAFMMAVCMLACIVPTRRALGVQPTEALKAE
jgi:putative ABC transport system permease protein